MSFDLKEYIGSYEVCFVPWTDGFSWWSPLPSLQVWCGKSEQYGEESKSKSREEQQQKNIIWEILLMFVYQFSALISSSTLWTNHFFCWIIIPIIIPNFIFFIYKQLTNQSTIVERSGHNLYRINPKNKLKWEQIFLQLITRSLGNGEYLINDELTKRFYDFLRFYLIHTNHTPLWSLVTIL